MNDDTMPVASDAGPFRLPPVLGIVGALTAPTSLALSCRVEEPSTASKGNRLLVDDSCGS